MINSELFDAQYEGPIHKFTQNSDQTFDNFQIYQNRISVITANESLQAIIVVNPRLLSWRRGCPCEVLTA